MNSALENKIRDKHISRSGYKRLTKSQIEGLGLVSAIPSESKKFHRDCIVFQIFHLNTYEKRYDRWDKIHQDLGMPRSSLRNAILDNRLEWDPKKADKSSTEGKPHFNKCSGPQKLDHELRCINGAIHQACGGAVRWSSNNVDARQPISFGMRKKRSKTPRWLGSCQSSTRFIPI